jgi:hypothetical protein
MRKNPVIPERERSDLLLVNANGFYGCGGASTTLLIASWAGSGTHTAVSSPARSRRANMQSKR